MKTTASNRSKIDAWRFTMESVGDALKVLQAAFGSKKAAVQQLANCVTAASFKKFSAGVVPVFSDDICSVSPREISPSASKEMLSWGLETGANIPAELAKLNLKNARTATVRGSKLKPSVTAKRSLATLQLQPRQTQLRLQYATIPRTKSSSSSDSVSRGSNFHAQ